MKLLSYVKRNQPGLFLVVEEKGKMALNGVIGLVSEKDEEILVVKCPSLR